PHPLPHAAARGARIRGHPHEIGGLRRVPMGIYVGSASTSAPLARASLIQLPTLRPSGNEAASPRPRAPRRARPSSRVHRRPRRGVDPPPPSPPPAARQFDGGRDIPSDASPPGRLVRASSLHVAIRWIGRPSAGGGFSPSNGEVNACQVIMNASLRRVPPRRGMCDWGPFVEGFLRAGREETQRARQPL